MQHVFLTDSGGWYFNSINVEEKDVTYKFLHPHSPINNFHWPRTEDKGYVPFNKFIIILRFAEASTSLASWQAKVEET